MAVFKAIKDIQKQLQIDGFYQGHLDGIQGAITQEGIRKAIESGKYKIDFDFSLFKSLFNKKTIDQKFVDALNSLFKIFNEFNTYDGTNPLYISYMLATAWHETAYTMLPIKEYGSDTYFSKYGRGELAKRLGNNSVAEGILYAGRGHVMITGKANYRKFSLLLGIDLVGNPRLALDPVTSAKILTIGSLRGSFTGKKLSDYIRRGDRLEYVSARRVINGNDDALEIALHAEKFIQCITIKKV